MTSSNGNISRYWPFVWGIHRSPVNFPHKGQWRGALMFSLICAWINVWKNNHETGDLRHHCAHCEVIVMSNFYTYMQVSKCESFQATGIKTKTFPFSQTSKSILINLIWVSLQLQSTSWVNFSMSSVVFTIMYWISLYTLNTALLVVNNKIMHR